MSKTNIEWTHRPGTRPVSWNPLAGCTKISEGCANCYALRDSWRIVNNPKHPARYDGAVMLSPRGEPMWTGCVSLDEAELERPLRWRVPRTVFVCSMSDLFHSGVPEWFIWRVIETAWKAKAHTFQVLTKRAERMADVLTRSMWWLNDTPDNVWLGVTVESEWYTPRAYCLSDIPAPVKFLSLEPLLGPVDLDLLAETNIDWVLVGGESGAHARPMREAWVRDIIAQCRTWGVGVFVKQMGTVWAREHGLRGKASDPADWPEDLRVREWPA